MNETVTIKVRTSDGMIHDCSIEIIHTTEWKLVFSGFGLERKGFSGGDLFEALLLLRKTLEPLGIQVLCAGARRDVFPSGMSRSMGGGRKAYITRLGNPAFKVDLLDIFDYADAKMVGTVNEQQAYHEQWIASIRK